MNSSRSFSDVSRRDALRAFGASAVALAASLMPGRLAAADSSKSGGSGSGGSEQPAPTPPAPPSGPLKLPQLGFEYNALEPAIDAKTMEIHYTKHHQAYINNANTALKDAPALASMEPEAILRDMKKVPGGIHNAVRNNVGGHVNHTLFWDILKPGGRKMPGGSLEKKITSDLTSFDQFVRQFSEAATTRFGSGWAWLIVYNKKLSVTSSANQDSPLMDGATPILGIDVWEHAYYLNYQNRRPDYVKAVLGIINWDRVGARFDAAMKT